VPNSSGHAAACQCALRTIEQSVPYSTVIAAEHDIAIGNPPDWFTNAISTCAASQ
jgi:hypothetical protein